MQLDPTTGSDRTNWMKIAPTLFYIQINYYIFKIKHAFIVISLVGKYFRTLSLEITNQYLPNTMSEIFNDRQLLSAIFLFLYFISILFLVLKNRNNKDSEDYFLAGRELPFWALSITFIASWWGGGSAVDLIDQAFTHGISSFWIYGMPVLFSTFLMYVFAKGIRKMGTISQPQLMAERYNANTALLLSALILIFMVIGSAVQVIVIGKFFSTFFDISYELAAVIGTLIVVSYSFFGGFKGVVITDILQFVFLLIAAITLFVFAYNGANGLAGLRTTVAENQLDHFFDFTHKLSDNMAYIITFGAAWMIQANVWQRISATRTPIDAKKMMVMSFCAFLPLYLLVTFTGMLSRGMFDAVPEGGIASAIIFQQMPPLLAALIFVGICSAIMSTMDSMVNTGALVLTIDIYQPLRPNATDLQLVQVGRMATLLVAFLSLFIGLKIDAILTVSWIGSDFLATGAFVPLLMGFLWKRGTSVGAMASMLFGILFSSYNLLAAFDIGITVPWEIASTYQAMVGMISSFVIYIVVSLSTKANEKGAAFIEKAAVL